MTNPPTSERYAHVSKAEVIKLFERGETSRNPTFLAARICEVAEKARF